MDRNIFVGTSGWQYKHWRGPFYPDDLAQDEWLVHYAQAFSCVEINNSFYGLPERHLLRSWLERTPPEFRFTLMAPRTITHYKKLKNCENQVSTLFTRLDGLGDRLGPVLFQLPPRWRCNARRLRSFLDTLPEHFRYAFEFRDTTWHCDEVFELLGEYRAAFCVFDINGVTTPLASTADFVYVRLHGPAGTHTGNYHPQTLRGWAGRARGWLRKQKNVYLFFDNDERAYAARNAQRIRRYLMD